MNKLNNAPVDKNNVRLVVEHDGHTHYNISSKAKTIIGREICFSSYGLFSVPGCGNFQSVMGFFQWLRTGRSHELCRLMWGATSNSYLGFQADPLLTLNHCQSYVTEALYHRIISDENLAHAVANSSYPFAYYNIGPDGTTPIPVEHAYWMCDIAEEARIRVRDWMGFNF